MQRGGRANHERGSLGARAGGCLWLLGLVWVPSLALGQAGITYLYDAHGRLAAVVDPSADPASNVALYRYDAVGNLTAIERTGGATVTVLGFAPPCASAGASVRVTGTGYSATPSQNAVTLGGIPATVTAAAATELTVTVPGGAASGSIAVTAPGGGATSTESFTVGCAAPTITGFTPPLAVPGTAVVVTGTNFDPNPGNDRLTLNVLTGTIGAVTPTQIDTAVPVTGRSGGRIAVTTSFGTAVSTADLFIVPPGYTLADVGSTDRMTFPGIKTITIPANQIALVHFDGEQGKRVSIVKSNDQVPGFEYLTLWPPLANALSSRTASAGRCGISTMPTAGSSGWSTPTGASPRTRTTTPCRATRCAGAAC